MKTELTRIAALLNTYGLNDQNASDQATARK